MQCKSVHIPYLCGFLEPGNLALPSHLLRVLQLIQKRKISVRLSAFHPSYRKILLGSCAQPVHSCILSRDQSSAVASFSLVTVGKSTRPGSFVALAEKIRDEVVYSIQRVISLLLFPLHPAREDCQLRRKELEKVRDERAEVLEKVLELRPLLANDLEADFDVLTTDVL
ncbi:hypothetical protein BDR04DRAFT_1106620 [Suillus decipiens]|nr:hypothetical protein BDR04DRAFT_1106620 [Suillus decipiens]